AEDGIRDKLVTGVQTCALPIFGFALPFHCLRHHGSGSLRDGAARALEADVLNGLAIDTNVNREMISAQRIETFRFLVSVCDRVRSEERRVGKECRSRVSSCH